MQSAPPNPFVHAHVAVHRTSVIEHDLSTVPEGSEYTQAPFPEHTEPLQCKRKGEKTGT